MGMKEERGEEKGGVGKEGEGGKERRGRGWGEEGRGGEGRREETEGVMMRQKGCWHEYARSMVYVRVYMQECPSALCMYCMYVFINVCTSTHPALPFPRMKAE